MTASDRSWTVSSGGARGGVEGGRALGDAVVGGEGLAVEHALEAHPLPHAHVPGVRRAEEHRVAEQQRGQVDGPAGRVGDLERSDGGVGDDRLVLGDRQRRRIPLQRRGVVVVERGHLRGEPAERLAVARQRRVEEPLRFVVHVGHHRQAPHALERARADVRAHAGARIERLHRVAVDADRRQVLRLDDVDLGVARVVDAAREVDGPDGLLPRRESQHRGHQHLVDLLVAHRQVGRVVVALVDRIDGGAEVRSQAAVAALERARRHDLHRGPQRRIPVLVRQERRPLPGEAEVVLRVVRRRRQLRVAADVGAGVGQQVVHPRLELLERRGARQLRDDGTVGERHAGGRLLDHHVHVVLRVLVRLDGGAEPEQVDDGDGIVAPVVEDVHVRRDVVPHVVAEVAPREAGRERLAADLHLARCEQEALHVDAAGYDGRLDGDARCLGRRNAVVRHPLVGDVERGILGRSGIRRRRGRAGRAGAARHPHGGP